MPTSRPDPDLIALGIRQPWAELILRGIKTIEVRSVDTQVRGPIYLYASRKVSELPVASQAVKKHRIDLDGLPRGVLVGTVELVETRPCKRSDVSTACVSTRYLKNRFAWCLRNPHRLPEPLTVRFLPYGIWFYPFKRRIGARR